MDKNRQQTAVEWLHIELQKRFPKETFEMYNKNQLLYEDIIEQAKQMEREQIEKAHIEGQPFHSVSSHEAEQYYTQTYGTRLQNETN